MDNNEIMFYAAQVAEALDAEYWHVKHDTVFGSVLRYLGMIKILRFIDGEAIRRKNGTHIVSLFGCAYITADGQRIDERTAHNDCI